MSILKNHQRSALPSSPALISSSGIESLSVELLFLICEYVLWGEDGLVLLHAMRLACKRLNQAAIPFIFREIYITSTESNSRPLDRARNRARRTVWGHIRAHTKAAYIFPHPPLNWNAAIKLLVRCKQLESIEYRYHASIMTTRQPFPRALKNVLETRLQNVRLYISGYRFRRSDSKSIPISSVVSFRRLRAVSSSDAPSFFTDFLASARRLEYLQLICIAHLTVPQGGKQLLPPIKRLDMFLYDWSYSSEDAHKIWDFSRLEKLKFQNASVKSCCRFLEAVPFPRLTRVTKLSLILSDDNHTTELITLANSAVGNLKNLENLCLNCYQPPLLITLLNSVGHNLVALKLLDENFVRVVTLSNKDIEDIIRLCPRLKKLAIDLNIPMNEHLALYESLAQSRAFINIKVSTKLTGVTKEIARNKTLAHRDHVLSNYSDVSMRIERLHILGWNEDVVVEEKDWKVQVVIRRNGGDSVAGGSSWSQRKPHEGHDLEIGGTHYC